MGLYLLGGGFGESVVIDLPDRRLVVVDCCTIDGTNAPLALVRTLGGPVAIFMLTHPDLDHVRGAADIVKQTNPGEIWRYPLHAAPRDAIAKWAARVNSPLAQALAALDAHQHKTGGVFSVTHGQTWPGTPAAYSLRAFAPTPFDQERLGNIWDRLVGERPKRRRRLDAYLRRVAEGKQRLGDVANILSIGAVLTWAEHRVVLGGDILVGSPSPFSGWKGIIGLLQRRGPADLLTDPTVVKVAHHGSRHSFEGQAWDLHASTTRPLAALTPFQSKLPDTPTLKALRSKTSKLAISAVDAGLMARVGAAGWSPVAGAATAGSTPCVGAILSKGGGVRVWSQGIGAVLG